jgi:DNA end-binding protein Ku
MLWPDEVRGPDFGFLDEEVTVRPQELAMASSLIETLAADFDPTKFTDEYRAALTEMIDAKIAGREVVTAPAAGKAEPAGDLMAALRASIEAARAGRPGGTPAEVGSSADRAQPDETAADAAAPAAARTRAAAKKSAATSAPPKSAATKTAPKATGNGAKAPAKSAPKAPVRRSA